MGYRLNYSLDIVSLSKLKHTDVERVESSTILWAHRLPHSLMTWDETSVSSSDMCSQGKDDGSFSCCWGHYVSFFEELNEACERLMIGAFQSLTSVCCGLTALADKGRWWSCIAYDVATLNYFERACFCQKSMFFGHVPIVVSLYSVKYIEVPWIYWSFNTMVYIKFNYPIKIPWL